MGLLYLPAHLLIFAGTNIFTRRIGATGRRTSWRMVLLLGLIGMAGVVIAPHSPAKWSEPFFDFATGTFPLSIIASAMAAVNCFAIARKVNDIYRAPMKSLGFANDWLAFTVAHILFVRLVFSYDNRWAAYGLIILPYFIASVQFLRASYLFNRTSNY